MRRKLSIPVPASVRFSPSPLMPRFTPESRQRIVDVVPGGPMVDEEVGAGLGQVKAFDQPGRHAEQAGVALVAGVSVRAAVAAEMAAHIRRHVERREGGNAIDHDPVAGERGPGREGAARQAPALAAMAIDDALRSGAEAQRYRATEAARGGCDDASGDVVVVIVGRADDFVSIHTRHRCRANPPRLARGLLMRLFQSTPGIAAGRIALTA